jgi:hypothetical protein
MQQKIIYNDYKINILIAKLIDENKKNMLKNLIWFIKQVLVLFHKNFFITHTYILNNSQFQAPFIERI